MLIRSFASLVAAMVILASSVLSVSAHQLEESYVYFMVEEDAVSIRAEASFDDINLRIPLDADGDGVTSPEEFMAQADAFSEMMHQELTLRLDGQELELVPGEVTFLGIGDDTYFGQAAFSIPAITQAPENIELDFRYLFEEQSLRRNYALIESNFRTGIDSNETFISMVINPGDGVQSLSLMGPDYWRVFTDFVYEGIVHILIGYDHVLFLITLLLSAVMMVNSAGRWEPVDRFGGAFRNVLTVVTLFTISHTITLTLAALGIVELPPEVIEFTIALSIAVVALDNIFPIFHKRAWMVIFVFGLIHGFGFANVLAPLGIDPAARAVTLGGFNIGVELGQVAIVIVVFPILYMIRRWSGYVPLLLKGLSVLIIAISLYWSFDRFGAILEKLMA